MCWWWLVLSWSWASASVVVAVVVVLADSVAVVVAAAAVVEEVFRVEVSAVTGIVVAGVGPLRRGCRRFLSHQWSLSDGV